MKIDKLENIFYALVFILIWMFPHDKSCIGLHGEESIKNSNISSCILA